MAIDAESAMTTPHIARIFFIAASTELDGFEFHWKNPRVKSIFLSGHHHLPFADVRSNRQFLGMIDEPYGQFGPGTLAVQYVLPMSLQPWREPVPTAARLTWVWANDRSTKSMIPLQS
jgi:hypothetical protein